MPRDVRLQPAHTIHLALYTVPAQPMFSSLCPIPIRHPILRLTCSQMSVRCGTKYTCAAKSGAMSTVKRGGEAQGSRGRGRGWKIKTTLGRHQTKTKAGRNGHGHARGVGREGRAETAWKQQRRVFPSGCCGCAAASSHFPTSGADHAATAYTAGSVARIHPLRRRQ